MRHLQYETPDRLLNKINNKYFVMTAYTISISNKQKS